VLNTSPKKLDIGKHMPSARTFLTNKKFILVLYLAVLTVSVAAFGVLVIWKFKIVTHGEDSVPAEVETTYGSIRLVMGLNKTTYGLGESISINLTVVNISNETVLLGFTVPCKTNFVVCNKSSQTIFDYFSSVGWADTGVDMILDSGEALSQTLTWNQLEIDNFPPFASRQVQPGTYYIKGQIGPCLHYVGSPEDYDPLECTGFIKIETPKIQIEII